MPSLKKKQRKESVSSKDHQEEEESEDYGSSDEAGSSGGELGDGQMREVDQRNLLNYQTDSEDGSDVEGMSDDDDLAANLDKQRKDSQMNEAWGKRKKNYYKDDSDSDEGSEDEAELANEALRLQAIRQKKLAKQMAAKEDSEGESEDARMGTGNKVDVSSDEDDDDSDDGNKRAKIGDKLFDSEDDGGKHEETKRAAELNSMDPELVRKIIESDSPELLGLLNEFRESLTQANEKLLPFLTAARSGQVKSTASGMSYLEMKYNLLMSYCTFLTFYLLLKVEGKPVESHPVVHKLTHIKTLFEKLKPLDQKLQYQIEKMATPSGGAPGKEGGAQASGHLAHKPNIRDLEIGSDED